MKVLNLFLNKVNKNNKINNNVKRNMIALSESVINMSASGIRSVMAKALEMEMNHDKIIHLEVGQPNFKTPKHIVDACVNSINQGNTQYIANSGIYSLRETLSKMYENDYNIKTNINNIIVTSGSMLSLHSIIRCIFNKNNNEYCLLPIPGFPNYLQTLQLLGVNALPYKCYPNNNYLPNILEIEELIQNTIKLNNNINKIKCMIICNPGNPTGSNFSKQLIQDMLKLAQKYNILVISDEIYNKIIFDNEKHYSVLNKENENLIDPKMLAVISGVSKSYAMTGFRVGWTRTNNTDLIKLMFKLQEPVVSCGSGFNQMAAIEAINGSQECIQIMCNAYQERRNKAIEILKKRGYHDNNDHIPKGAFYFPLHIHKYLKNKSITSLEFTINLLNNKKVAIAPGSAFITSDLHDINYKNNIDICDRFCRISLASSMNDIENGIQLICDYLDELNK